MIQVRNLHKQFGSKRAVDGVTFSVEKGEVLGFLGPNGAGKSTTMRMITGFIPPTEGEITIGGHSITDEPLAAQRLIGYLPENAPSYADMTVGGFLTFCAELRGLAGAKRKEAIERVVTMCYLEPVFYQSIETLSKGYRHRTCFAQSIIHDPAVLILDEPTDGLDPNQKHEVRSLIRKMGETKAIIFSTHILEEVEAVCTRAMIIDRGKVVANGTPEELKSRAPQAGVVTLRFQRAPGTAAEVIRKIATIAGAGEVTPTGESPLIIQVAPSGKPQPTGTLALALYKLASTEKWALQELHTEEGRLDEIFRSLTLGDRDAKEVAV